MIIYVSCHNDTPNIKAQDVCAKFNMAKDMKAKVVQIEECHKMFESQIFTHLDENKNEWIDENMVGIVTYSIDDKMKDSGLTGVEKLFDNIRNAVNGGADIVPFLNYKFEKTKIKHTLPFIEAATIQHGPYFLLVYKEILDTLGYSEHEYFDDMIPSYFCNWWIVKPKYMLQYLKFFKQCVNVIENNVRLNRYLNKHSYYPGKMTEDQLVKTTGNPYYTLHPFIFERFPCFFFHNLGIKHGFVSSTKCLLND